LGFGDNKKNRVKDSSENPFFEIETSLREAIATK